MEILVWLFAGLMGSYAFLTLGLWIGWELQPVFVPSAKIAPPQTLKWPCISILIPVRNEAKNLPALLRDLAFQTTPPGFFEVIVIDDRSDDGSPELVQQFAAQAIYPLHLCLLPPEAHYLAPKKAALQAGIRQARGTLIMTTDGDCRVKPTWVAAFWQFYQAQKPCLISGPVVLDYAQTWFERMQIVEFASLVGAGAATLYWQKPTMSNGANLAFPKAVFEAVGGYEGFMHLASGDDEFLMHKIARRFPGRVAFLKSQEALVHTAALPGLADFVAQRQRWASKWRHYAQPGPVLLVIYLFGVHLAMLIAGLGAGLGIFAGAGWLWGFGAKFLVEYFYLYRVLQFFKKGGSFFSSRWCRPSIRYMWWG
ncbi:MAG: glycosyltransferase [Microscillaceae bacterium]|nr:glycosyltransferase [Microscillaceae bacterium]